MEHSDPVRQMSSNIYNTPLLCVQWKTPDDGQRNCPKHVEFHSKNKFEKLVHLVVFIIRNYITMHGHMNVKFLRQLSPSKRRLIHL